jgi:GNAT superfamily N-acetyltransferase
VPETVENAGPSGDGISVEQVPPELTHALRARVLRRGQPPDKVRLAGFTEPGTVAFAARTPDGEVVGTTIVYPEPCAWRPGARAWRLRGMATEPALQGRGIGGRVLAAALAHARAQGAEVVWCNARIPARAFYERAGFVAHGDEWDDPDIGPHVAMAVDLST